MRRSPFNIDPGGEGHKPIPARDVDRDLVPEAVLG